jgi:hypothetical protein
LLAFGQVCVCASRFGTPFDSLKHNNRLADGKADGEAATPSF